MYSCKVDKYCKGAQGAQGIQGLQGLQGIQGIKGELPSPSLNAAIPYEPWHLDNTTATFSPVSNDVYCIQFFAPSTAEYTHLYLYNG